MPDQFRVFMIGSTLPELSSVLDHRDFTSFLDAVLFAEWSDSIWVIKRRAGFGVYVKAITVERYNELFQFWVNEDSAGSSASSEWRDSLTPLELELVQFWDKYSVNKG